MKKRAALLLAAVMMLTMLPVNAFAANGDKIIALTFDDGPSAYTKRLLDGLRERGVKCTFFVVGSYAGYRPELIKQMWYDGHQVASHTYDHPYLTELSDANIRSQLDKTDAALDKAIGFDQDYMLRPPYGDFSDRVLKTANVPCFYWSMDTLDWKLQNADSVYANFLKYAKDGSLALLHDSHSTSVDAALRAVDYYLARGYEFVTVSEMFYRRGIELKNGQIYYSAYPGSYGTADGIKEPVVTTADTDNGRQISIKGDSRGSVYYTTNGEYPTPVNSKLYTEPFYVTGGTTVKAVSVLKWNGLRSDVTTFNVKYNPTPTPVIGIRDGTVTLSCAKDGAEIFYTVDGTSPDRNSALYTGPFEAVPGTEYAARAYAKSLDPSAAEKVTYTHNGNLVKDVYLGDWYYKAVDRAMTEGLFNGMSSRTFEPDYHFSRAMLTTVLYRLSGSPDVSGLSVPFSDATEGSWYYDAVAWAYNSKVVKGYSLESFKPDKDITREEMCAMLARYIRGLDKDLSGVGDFDLGAFRDGTSVNKTYIKDMKLVCGLGIVAGYSDKTIGPQRCATRAEAATMILRMEDALAALPDIVSVPDTDTEPVRDEEPVPTELLVN